MKQIKPSGFQIWLAEQMLLVTPKNWFRKSISTEAKIYFYELVCHRAALRPESNDVKKAFNYLMSK